MAEEVNVRTTNGDQSTCPVSSTRGSRTRPTRPIACSGDRAISGIAITSTATSVTTATSPQRCGTSRKIPCVRACAPRKWNGLSGAPPAPCGTENLPMKKTLVQVMNVYSRGSEGQPALFTTDAVARRTHWERRLPTGPGRPASVCQQHAYLLRMCAGWKPAVPVDTTGPALAAQSAILVRSTSWHARHRPRQRH